MRTERFKNYEASYGNRFSLILMKFSRKAKIELFLAAIVLLAMITHLTYHKDNWDEAQTLILLGLAGLVYFLRQIVSEHMVDVSERLYQIPALSGRRIDFDAICKKVFLERANLRQYGDDVLLEDAVHAEYKANKPGKKLFASVIGIYCSIFSILGYLNHHLLGKEDWDTKLLGLKLSLLPILLLTIVLAVVLPPTLDYRRDRKRKYLDIAKWLNEWSRKKKK